MARLKLEIDIPGKTVAELQHLVHVADGGQEWGIDASNVRASDVWMFISAGDLEIDHNIVVDEMVDGPRCRHPLYSDGFCHHVSCSNVDPFFKSSVATDPQYQYGA